MYINMQAVEGEKASKQERKKHTCQSQQKINYTQVLLPIKGQLSSTTTTSELKQTYKSAYDQLKEERAAVDYMQKSIDRTRECLRFGIKMHLITPSQMGAQGNNSTSSLTSLHSPKALIDEKDPVTEACNSSSSRSGGCSRSSSSSGSSGLVGDEGLCCSGCAGLPREV